jgi:hypothetical protein
MCGKIYTNSAVGTNENNHRSLTFIWAARSETAMKTFNHMLPAFNPRSRIVMVMMVMVMFAVLDKMHSGRRPDRVCGLQNINECECQESNCYDFFHGTCWFVSNCRFPVNRQMKTFYGFIPVSRLWLVLPLI